MNKDFDQIYADELLKTALIEDAMMNSLIFFDEITNKEKHRFSKEFDGSIISKAQRIFRKKQMKRVLRYTRKCVATVFVLFGLLFASLFTVKASRDYLIKSFMEIKNHFLEIEYKEEGKEASNYQMLKPTYIPMGYTQISSYSDAYQNDVYRNEKEETLSITYTPIQKDSVSGLNTDGYRIEKIKIGNYRATLLTTSNEEMGNMIVWNDGKTEYLVSISTTDRNEILKIARSFK